VNDPELRTRRATGVYAALIAVIGVLVVLPLTFGPQLADSVDAVIAQAQRGHLGLPVAIALFTLASFIGAPQPVLVGACVLATGAWDGFLYGWLGTIVAGSANYFVGRAFHSYAHKRIDGFAKWRWINFVRRKPFVSSLAIRSVPTAPFVVVNMAFGAARTNFWPFLAGLVLGSLPKTAIIAFAGKGVLEAFEGNIAVGVSIVVAASVLWIAVGWYLRKRAQKNDERRAF